MACCTAARRGVCAGALASLGKRMAKTKSSIPPYRRRSRQRGWPARIFVGLVRLVLGLIVLSILWVLVYRFVPPPITVTPASKRETASSGDDGCSTSGAVIDHPSFGISLVSAESRTVPLREQMRIDYPRLNGAEGSSRLLA